MIRVKFVGAMFVIVYCTKLHLYKYNASRVVCTKKTMNFKINPPQMFVIIIIIIISLSVK
jgi:hypothetical protein